MRRKHRGFPLDFLSRLAALVPKPKVNLTRFHGVFAPRGASAQRVGGGGLWPPIIRPGSDEALSEGQGAQSGSRIGLTPAPVAHLIL